MSMNSVPSANAEAPSSSHVEITPSANDEAPSSSHGEKTPSANDEAPSSSQGKIEITPSANDEAPSSSHGEIEITLSESDEAPSSSHGEISPTYMDPIFYKAAVDGNFEPFAKIEKDLSLIMTPDGNTILHIHVRSKSKVSTAATTTFMNQVLDRWPTLLMRMNIQGDTLLHVAAKYGNTAAIDILIESAKLRNWSKEMLRKINNKGNTPLHEAVQNCFADVVSILTKEDSDFFHQANNLGETLLTIAIGKGFDGEKLLDEILTNCRNLNYYQSGPHGTTVLHAAVNKRNSFYSGSHPTKKILEKMKSLAKEMDEYGWTPLHYAAYYGNSRVVKILLEVDVSAAFIGDKKRAMTPLLLAASQGHLEIVKEIISQCPTCYELVDSRGWNILHYALLAEEDDIDFYDKIILKYFPVRKLIHENDDEGNTPFHLLASLSPHRFNKLDRRIKSISDTVTNKQGFSIEDVRSGRLPQLKEDIIQLSNIVYEPYRNGVVRLPKNYEEETKEDEDEDEVDIQKARRSHLVVAALIATVTFAAAFTLPGGYIQSDSNHQGTAILKRNPAFQAFIITNDIAMVLSISAVSIHFIMSLRVFRSYIFMFWYAFCCTLLAMGAMVICFITGAYAMLGPSLGLALGTIFIGLAYFFLVIFLFSKLANNFGKTPLNIAVVQRSDGEALLDEILTNCRKLISRSFMEGQLCMSQLSDFLMGSLFSSNGSN